MWRWLGAVLSVVVPVVHFLEGLIGWVWNACSNAERLSVGLWAQHLQRGLTLSNYTQPSEHHSLAAATMLQAHTKKNKQTDRSPQPHTQQPRLRCLEAVPQLLQQRLHCRPQARSRGALGVAPHAHNNTDTLVPLLRQCCQLLRQCLHHLLHVQPCKGGGEQRVDGDRSATLQ